MSHELDQSNGRSNFAFTGQPAWHGLGHNVEADASLEEWGKAAGFEWDARPIVPYVRIGGKEVPLDGWRALVRSDTHEPLSVVSADYNPVQPADVLEFFREFVGSMRFAMETLGCLRGGRKIWGLAKAKDKLLLGKDQTDRYLLLATSFDLSIKTVVQQTSVRVVCANTLGTAYAKGEAGAESRIEVGHLSKWRPDDVKRKLAQLDENWAGFCECVEVMASKKIKERDARNLFMETYYPPEVRDGKKFSLPSANNTIDRLLNIYDYAPGQNLASARGTVWGAVNAVTYHVDHELKSLTPDTRLDKAWFGRGNDLKSRSLALASAMV